MVSNLQGFNGMVNVAPFFHMPVIFFLGYHRTRESSGGLLKMKQMRIRGFRESELNGPNHSALYLVVEDAVVSCSSSGSRDMSSRRIMIQHGHP